MILLIGFEGVYRGLSFFVFLFIENELCIVGKEYFKELGFRF